MPQAETVASPARLPLVFSPDNRDETTGKDAKLVNGYMEKSLTEQYHLYKRPGLLTNLTKSGNGLGVYNWKGDIYAIFGTSLFKNGTSAGTVDATGGVYRFSSTLGGTPRLVLGNGVKAYTYDGATLTEITDPDFPSPFVKGWAYLDGTLYVMDAEANIQGSDLNNPASWDAGNVITAQIEPDGGVALGKQLVYVIAFKQWTTEVFYDAASPTGSPLKPVQGARVNLGCANAETVQDIDGVLYWLATTRASSLQIVSLDGLKAAVVSTKPIERLLDGADYSGSVYSWNFKHNGHAFYVLTIAASNLTLVYDIRERLWYQWADTNGDYFPIVASTANTNTGQLVQHRSNGKLYVIDGDYVNDDGQLFTVDIYAPNFDGGVRRRKHLSFMEFTADQTVGSILKVRHNDDDYHPMKWTNFRTVDLSKKRPYLTNCGTFYRRAYHFRHRANTRLRLQSVDLQLDLGTL